MFKNPFKKSSKNSTDKDMFKHIIMDDAMNIIAAVNDLTVAEKLCDQLSETEEDTFYITTDVGFNKYSIAGRKRAIEWQKNREMMDYIQNNQFYSKK